MLLFFVNHQNDDSDDIEKSDDTYLVKGDVSYANDDSDDNHKNDDSVDNEKSDDRYLERVMTVMPMKRIMTVMTVKRMMTVLTMKRVMTDTWRGWQDESRDGGRAASRSCLSVNLKKREIFLKTISRDF